jgi:beta-aspartyl-peptidase (threonine type)
MEYGGMSLQSACSKVMYESMPSLSLHDKYYGPDKENGQGGLIAIDKEGNFEMPFNTSGMYRGYITSDDEIVS